MLLDFSDRTRTGISKLISRCALNPPLPCQKKYRSSGSRYSIRRRNVLLVYGSVQLFPFLRSLQFSVEYQVFFGREIWVQNSMLGAKSDQGLDPVPLLRIGQTHDFDLARGHRFQASQHLAREIDESNVMTVFIPSV